MKYCLLCFALIIAACASVEELNQAYVDVVAKNGTAYEKYIASSGNRVLVYRKHEASPPFLKLTQQSPGNTSNGMVIYEQELGGRANSSFLQLPLHIQ